MGAGRLDQRVTFQQAVLIHDPDGMLIQGWEDRFTLGCHVLYLRGSEAVVRARFVSTTPVILTVWASTEARTETFEWQAVDDAVIFDLREDPRSTDNGKFLEVLAEA